MWKFDCHIWIPDIHIWQPISNSGNVHYLDISGVRLDSILDAQGTGQVTGHDPQAQFGTPTRAEFLCTSPQVAFLIADGYGDDVLHLQDARRQYLLGYDEFDGGVAFASILAVPHANQGFAIFGLEAFGAVLSRGQAFADAGFECWAGCGGFGACLGVHAGLPVFSGNVVVGEGCGKVGVFS